MERREFLSVAALGAGTLAAGVVNALQAEEKAKTFDPFELVQLTKDIKCSRIGFGTGMRGSHRTSELTRVGWPKGIEMLQYGYDLGVRLFDCADMYGTHFMLAEAMKGRPRDSYTVVTKLWLHPTGGLPEKERLAPEETLPRLLRELRTDYVDVLQIHCMSSGNWAKDFEAAMESMEKLKQQGRIRAHGISSHSFAATQAASELDWCDVIHCRINSEGMSMDGSRQDGVAQRVASSVECIQKAKKAGKGIIAMKVLGEGGMAHDAEMRKKSTEFVANLDCVDAMIVGFTEKEHITEFVDNVKAVQRS